VDAFPLSMRDSFPSSLKRSSKVDWVRLRGLMKTWASFVGSISLSGPTSIFPVLRTCWMPFSVRSSSVLPV